MNVAAVRDAFNLFETYLKTTKLLTRAVGLTTGGFIYPDSMAQMDMMVFATVFTNVWETIKGDFAAYYPSKIGVFAELVNITVPNEHSKYNAFYHQTDIGLPVRSVADQEGMMWLCRTLRNGFNHFNYRYDNVSPDAYFARLRAATPPVIPKPSEISNYRIFICDHNPGAKIMDAGSNTRILDVGFAHLRFHLHAFLARFFEAELGRPHTVGLFDLPLKEGVF